MHKDISVAVASRHRPKALTEFVKTFWETVDPLERERIPHLQVIYDKPEQPSEFTWPKGAWIHMQHTTSHIALSEKGGLAELWNWCIMLAPTDWVLICNDDVTFNEGWLDYLEETIATGKYDLIHLFHYGAMCIHKSLILKLGWFDENFRGGGFEDIDYQLRISEAGLKDRVDRSHDFIRKEGKVEVGHFINHIRDVAANGSWSGENNAEYMCEKWSRRSPYNYKIPSFRAFTETDWHPSYRRKYEEKFGMKYHLDENYPNAEEIYL